MTWVIATNVPFLGYAIATSDIRVSFGDLGHRREKDCLQKLYPVGQYLAAGFAGAVEIGFDIIRSLQDALRVENDPSVAWDPTVIAEKLPTYLQQIFQKYPVATRQHGCELILLGAHPTEDVGIPHIGRTYVYSFRSPNFGPVQAKPHEMLSIGSGSDVGPYREVLERYFNDHKFRSLLMQGESMPGGMATMLAGSITRVLKRHPKPGISQHLHLGLVKLGTVRIWSNDHSYSDSGRWESWSLGPPENNPNYTSTDMHAFTMPPVATSFDELKKLLDGDAVLASNSVVCA